MLAATYFLKNAPYGERDMNEHDETKIVLDGIAGQVREISGRYVNLAQNQKCRD